MTDPLTHHCPVCLAPPGRPCRDTVDEPESEPHGLRGVMVRCIHCQGVGWRPEGLETK